MLKTFVRLFSFIVGTLMVTICCMAYSNGIEVPYSSYYVTILPLLIFLCVHWIPGKDILFDG